MGAAGAVDVFDWPLTSLETAVSPVACGWPEVSTQLPYWS